MLQLMIFALVFGIAVSATTPKAKDDNVVIRVLEQVFDACMRIVQFVMRFAPLAVFAIIFNTVFTFGAGVLSSLFLYVVTVVGGLLLQQFGVYSAMLWLVAKRSPLAFFRQCREVYLYAFSTASSNATLPLSLEVAEVKLHLPANISRFVLTVGATANQNGTALFEGITVLFLAQVYALDLTVGQQVRVMLMSILAGVGTAGVPGGSLPMVLIVAQSVGVPAEGMGLILGVDRFLDMCRTAVNVSGDLVIAALVTGPAVSGSSQAPRSELLAQDPYAAGLDEKSYAEADKNGHQNRHDGLRHHSGGTLNLGARDQIHQPDQAWDGPQEPHKCDRCGQVQGVPSISLGQGKPTENC